VPEPSSPAGRKRPALFALAAWLLPSAGHFLLGRSRRAAVFLLVIGTALATGLLLEGNLYRPISGQPMSYLASFGAMGSGLPYVVLRWLAGYEGQASAAGYEYGTAFLLSAGLMNLLLVLDAWDIATGRKG
jgi:hypothetical protein